MNVLVVEDIASSTFGGAERSMRAFSERLAREGHAVHLVYDRRGDYADNRDGFYASVTRISVLPIRAQPALCWIRSISELVRLCRSRQIDVVVTHVVHSAPMLRVLRMLTGVRLTMYFKWICDFPDVGAQARWGLMGFDHGAAVSRFVANYWITNGFPADRMEVIPEGVSFEGDAAVQVDSQRRSRSFTVAFAGRIVPEKGLDLLIDVISGLAAKGVDVRCHVAGAFEPGQNDYHRELDNHITALNIRDRFKFEGYVSQLSGFFRDVDLVVVPSLCQDAQPLVLLEAMAVGVPVLAARVGGIPEILGANFDSLMFESANPAELEARILAVMNMNPTSLADLRSRLRSHLVRSYAIETSHIGLLRTFKLNC